MSQTILYTLNSCWMTFNLPLGPGCFCMKPIKKKFITTVGMNFKYLDLTSVKI